MTWTTTSRSPIFEFPSKKVITRVQTSRNVDISRNSNVKWPYFGTAWGYSQMVGYAGSPIGIVHADLTLTRSKVKIKVTGLLNFRKLWLWLQVRRKKPCVLASMTVSPPPCGSFINIAHQHNTAMQSTILILQFCLFVRPSVTRWYCVKTHPIIRKSTLDGTLGTVVFWRQRSWRNSTGSFPTGALNTGGMGKIDDFP